MLFAQRRNVRRVGSVGLAAYRHSQEDPIQQRVLAHADMVKRIALHLNDRLDGRAELDELIQTGFIGLLEAARRYDDAGGVPFEAFALNRVRGAMIDELRRNDWCPRTLRRQAVDIRKVREQLEQQGQSPTDRRMADLLELDLAEYQRICSRLDSARLMSLEMLQEDRVTSYRSQRVLIFLIHQRAQHLIFIKLKHWLPLFVSYLNGNSYYCRFITSTSLTRKK